MIRGNLGMAMQGLAVVPLFAGYDIDRRAGRIFSYDITGGRYEEREHHSVGSGLAVRPRHPEEGLASRSGRRRRRPGGAGGA